jgi:nitrite reductase/ring-hydroxylating ferredoxin subunit
VSANGGEWVTVAKVGEVAAGSVKHVEVHGIEVSLINRGGRFFAISDRCGHMNAPLSKGHLASSQGKEVVVCPLHGSTFDIATGLNMTGPVKGPPLDPSTVPKPVLDTLARAAELSADIKVHDLTSFQVRLQGDDLQVSLRKREGV